MECLACCTSCSIENDLDSMACEVGCCMVGWSTDGMSLGDDVTVPADDPAEGDESLCLRD